MDLGQIEAKLRSSDVQERIRAMTALRAYAPAVAVPLLRGCSQDPEFVVRSLAAMTLGHKRTPESFALLQGLLHDDADANVRAESANAIAAFGETALPDLMRSFREDQHWLVRLSILAALQALNQPQILFDSAVLAIADTDLSVREAAIDLLATFAGSPMQTFALDKLLPLARSEHWQLRAHLARALHCFDQHQARETLQVLRQDDNHHVVAAVLEGSVRPSPSLG
ncbi:HEAT repeat domain-containing protein [Synechococcus elongatus]|nr:HEAT repeat domain-containing protein [Synechococcus elongatus]AJD57180.1 phycocyanobilin lyase [Synechococcus elongatus UTEX 2973]MBD2587077.1 HEAT repeat domain-containing protein [Synechococcus elongatus FACHB-242]MBD2688148.1 HEAT repeat domain-containing protein [Synechococcus elongatus FACHB-1061]MBD2706141.1 HEAT repeat domain-containing protein [Synechococcus elongatus PCC 7942 = FACHB-805]UOW72154.1 HEAT repeat-containing protein [Synechococcus elongatus PCC 7943]